MAAVEGAYSGTQAFGVTGVRRDGVDLGAGVSQGVRKLSETVGASSDQGHAVAALGESASHRHSKARPGADQQQVTVVDRSGACWFLTAIAHSVVGHELVSFRINGRGSELHIICRDRSDFFGGLLQSPVTLKC
jgi:hypothetical protein